MANDFKVLGTLPADKYRQLRTQGSKLRTIFTNMSGQLSANISGEEVISMVRRMHTAKGVMNGYLGDSELKAYAATIIVEVPPYDLDIAINGVITLIDTCITTVNGFSTNALIDDWSANGIDWNSFTPAQTTPLKASLDAVVAAIS